MHKPYTEVEVRLYKSNDDAAGANAALKYLSPDDAKPAGESGLGKPSKTVKLYFAEREYEPFMQVFKNDQEDKHLSRLIAASHTLLDSDFLELYIGINGYVNYHVEDFWYFSAITITTLGFGDITPNSTPVRRVVMFETLFGVLLLGFYMSKVGLNRQRREQAGTNSAEESIR
ncbi:two pore domain potassium channel family protein [Paenibacillus rhizovicinus]|uniref:Two pore domain potassium channel family protein n=2 Tax=Paenibacillus rhizovicinus TaxID=2704463 RepID=A0A6C0P9V3_9BACL|nr:two pore domain potassium channel family protein [Paenibacillus rhizovicinus]